MLSVANVIPFYMGAGIDINIFDVDFCVCGQTAGMQAIRHTLLTLTGRDHCKDSGSGLASISLRQDSSLAAPARNVFSLTFSRLARDSIVITTSDSSFDTCSDLQS